MPTPFEKAGYTKETRFKVVDPNETWGGCIVVLEADDGTFLPFFELEGSPVNGDHQCFDIRCDLEVVEEETQPEYTERELAIIEYCSALLDVERTGCVYINCSTTRAGSSISTIATDHVVRNGERLLAGEFKREETG